MYLGRVCVRNFRNLQSLDLAFAPGLNVLVGENNVGKTNVLDAIRIALGPASSGDFVRITPHDRHRLADGTVITLPITVDLTFLGLSSDEQAELLDILNYNAETPETSTASVHFEWTYSDKTERSHTRRWGGDRPNNEAVIPEDILDGIPLTLLTAMRDALSALVPGRASRLGRVLKASAEEDDKKELESIIAAANEKLQGNRLLTAVETRIRRALERASGLDLSQAPAIRAADPSFDRIVNSLRLMLRERGVTPDGLPVFSDLATNGLGYNNLLYIGTVLAELEKTIHAAMPLLVVEEPEAHLHPQLQTLLANYLAKGGADAENSRPVQTIVTTHSPTIASHVDPRFIRVLHASPEGVRCVSIDACGLDDRETRQLRRMFDVTRASLLFARGVILVEGISEALLLPVLARRLGLSLEDKAVSVIPVAGVDFGTLGKLFGKTKLRIPIAIVTDADPPVLHRRGKEETWRNALVVTNKAGVPLKCKRLFALQKLFVNEPQISVEHSSITLEHELALAGDRNAEVVYDAWASCYQEGPDNLPRAELIAETNRVMRANLLWRALCRGRPSHGKAEVAQALAEALDQRDAAGTFVVPEFTVPDYLTRAIRHVRNEAP